MAETVNVGAIDAIDEVRAAVLRLREDTLAAIVAARLAAQNERDWLAERRQHWQRRVSALSEELIEAEAALARCRRQSRSASDGCQAVATWAERTRRALWDAEAELRTARHWSSVVDERIAAFEHRARLLTRELSNRVPLASAELSHLAARLNDYTAG